MTKKAVYFDRTSSFAANYFILPVQDWKGYLAATPYTPFSEPSPTSLAGWGAIGYNRTFPLHPIYQLGVSLVELKDLPHMLTQTRDFLKGIRNIPLTRVPKTVGDFIHDLNNGAVHAGGDYLNLQFGWVPFIQDLVFLSQMKAKLRKKMVWLTNKNGKAVRRKIELDKAEFSENIDRFISEPGSMTPTLPTMLYDSNVVTSYSMPVRRDVYSRIWFSAKYRFYIPELANDPLLLGDHRLLEGELLGLALDPTILYKVTAWSWLLDWFTSVGAVIQNIYLRAKYHVVAEYAYVMCDESHTYSAPGRCTVHTGKASLSSGGNWSGVSRTLSGITTTKYTFHQREVANPYGFGITFASLSAYQWSILAALGLSRGGKHLSPRT